MILGWPGDIVGHVGTCPPPPESICGPLSASSRPAGSLTRRPKTVPRCASPQRLSQFGENRDLGISECGFVKEVTDHEEVERGPHTDSGGGRDVPTCPRMFTDHHSIIVPHPTGPYRPLEQSYRFCDICLQTSTPVISRGPTKIRTGSCFASNARAVP